MLGEPLLITATQASAGPLTLVGPLPAYRLIMFHGFNSATGSSQFAYLKWYVGNPDPVTAAPDFFFVLPPGGQTVLPINVVIPAGFGVISSAKVGVALPNSDVHIAVVLQTFI